MKKSITFLFTAILIVAIMSCDSKADSTSATTPIEKQSPNTPKQDEESDYIKQLRAQSYAEDDIIGRVMQGVKIIESNYKASESLMGDKLVKNVVWKVDEQCNATVSNEAGAGSELNFNFKDLDITNVSLVKEEESPNRFPGITFNSNNGKKIFTSKEGGNETKVDRFTIYLADRNKVGKLAPALMQTVRICREVAKK